MAAAANILQDLQRGQGPLKEQLDLPSLFISGTPDLYWSKYKILLDLKLSEKRIGSLDAKSVADGTAPGGRNAGGAAVAGAVQAAFNSASQSVYGLLMGKTAPGTAMFKLLSQPPYLNDAEYTYGYINFAQQAAPTAEDIKNFEDKWTSVAFKNAIKPNANSQYQWLDHLITMNNEQPVIMQKTNLEVAKKWSHYNHSAINSKTMDIFEAAPAALMFPVNYPATLFPGGPAHPQAGNPHAQAGQWNMTAFVSLVDTRWKSLIREQVIHVPVANLMTWEASSSNEDVQQLFEVGTSNDEAISVYQLIENGFSVSQVQELNRKSLLPRCYGCGGVNHYAVDKSGKWQCLTERDSVSKTILLNIKYPSEVMQPRSGKGKGKGKGFGKGFGKGKFGKGKGTSVTDSLYQMLLEAQAESQYEDVAGETPELDASEPIPPAVVAALMAEAATTPASVPESVPETDGFSVEDYFFMATTMNR